jgi:hypothetical protein
MIDEVEQFDEFRGSQTHAIPSSMAQQVIRDFLDERGVHYQVRDSILTFVDSKTSNFNIISKHR